METEAAVYAVDNDRVLYLTLPERDPRRRSPIVPDHGKLMHLILVKSPGMEAMLHLHPQRLNRRTFVASVPGAPPGTYELYGEVTYETGFAENLTNLVEIPKPGTSGRSSAGVTMQADPDDSWHTLNQDVQPKSIGGQVFQLGDGLVMEWMNDGYVNEGEDLSLRFQVRDAAGQPKKLEPYMGMLGHLMMRSHDGHLFTHLHPSGSFSMASQQLFDLRAEGKAPPEVNVGGLEPFCRIPGVEESLETWLAQKSAGADQSIGFPWKFMEHGLYRIWVQVKIDGRVRTGVFDIQVRHAS